MIEGLRRDDDVEIESFCDLERSSPVEIAQACRAAGLAFIAGVGRGWTKRELAEWLLGPYSEAACTLPGAIDPGITSTPGSAIQPVTVQKLLRETRDTVLAVLGARTDRVLLIGTWAEEAGAIMRSQHEGGGTGWIPVSLPRMRLEDRVLSLFAVDSLVRRDDYVRLLGICRRCRAVTFDARCRETGRCTFHDAPPGSTSGVRPRVSLPPPSAKSDGTRS